MSESHKPSPPPSTPGPPSPPSTHSGAVRRKGHAPCGAEWNMWCDPRAATATFEAAAAAGIVLVLLANDCVNEDAIDVHSEAVSRLCEPVACDEEGLAATQLARKRFGRRLVALQPEALTMDPLAAAYVLDPSLFEMEETHVAVDPDTGVTYEVGPGKGARLQLATRIDSRGYERLLLKELLN